MKSFVPLNVVGLMIAVLLLTPSNAWAYIDPGTGSYLFQLSAAAFLAGAYTLRRYWRAVKDVFSRIRGGKSAAGQRDDG